MAIDGPEATSGAPPSPGAPGTRECWGGVGAGQHRRNFLAARGTAVPAPTGEESCDAAVAPKRSRRRCPSGRLGQTHNGDQGDPEDPSGKTGQALPV